MSDRAQRFGLIAIVCIVIGLSLRALLMRQATGNLQRFQGQIPPALAAGGTWINSDPLTLDQLRGKAVLLQFGFLG